MKMMKNWKRFWTLDRHHAAGFTLVELIVVIAILAILAGVAVPAYSGYISEANKTADKSLAADVARALTMYYYNNPNVDTTKLWVKLDQEGKEPVIDGNYTAESEEAMKAAFGDNWIAVLSSLKYGDWKGVNSTKSYKDSSFHGNENRIISTVDKLTTALGDVIEKDQGMADALIGGGFGSFLEDYGVDKTDGKAVGNTAVLYVAQNTQGKEETIKKAYSDAFNSGETDPAAVADKIFNNMYKEVGTAAALASVYAYIEGYAQHTDQTHLFNPDFSNVSGADSTQAAATAMDAIRASLGAMDTSEETFGAYLQEQSAKDIQGYIDMMGTVHENRDLVSGNLTADDCYTDGIVEKMLLGHAAMGDAQITVADGQIAVVLYVVNGVVTTYNSTNE